MVQLAEVIRTCSTKADDACSRKPAYYNCSSPQCIAATASQALRIVTSAERSGISAAYSASASSFTRDPGAANKMVKKRVDDRVKRFVEEGVRSEQRSLIVLVGDHGKDQVVNLHQMLARARVAARPSVLWCYK